MKRYFLFSICLFVSSFVFANMDTIPTPLNIKIDLAPESKNWKEFNSYDGRFSILSPGEMKEKVDSVETAIGTLAYHTFFFQTEQRDADNVVYMITYCDYPWGTVHSDSTDLLRELFETTMEAAAESVDGDLMYDRNIKYKGFPGKIWRIDYLDGQALIKTRAYVIENRYYTIQTVTHKSRSINASSEKFLDSFKLIGDIGK